MAGPHLTDVSNAKKSSRGGDESGGEESPKPEGPSVNRTVKIDESNVLEVFPELGDHTTHIDRSKLRPVKGRAPTPIPSEEEWNLMKGKIQQLAATGGAGEHNSQASSEKEAQEGKALEQLATLSLKDKNDSPGH